MFRIAIDGPGGAGKSSVAKLIAKKLGIIYVDTGALYRAIGLSVLNKGISPADKEAVVSFLPSLKIELKFTDRQILLVNGTDVSDKIRTPEVSMAASAVSAIPEVRTSLLALQQNLAKKQSVIMDGRDIGTVIIPSAELKIFLTASPEARAKRRFDELTAKGINTTLEQVLAEMNERDRNDSTRDVAPCVPAKDAIFLDNSNLNLEQTANAICSMVDVKKQTVKSDRTFRRTYRWLAPIVKFLFHIRVHGAENVPKEGGVLVCANHIAVRDVFIVAYALHRPVHFIAKKELFAIPIVGSLIRAIGAISVDRGNNDIGAIKKSISLAKTGNAVAMFPQGHRMPGKNPADTQPQNGAGLIAFRSGVDVLPVCIKVKNVKYGLFKPVDLMIGDLIPNKEFDFQKGGTEEYQNASRKIFDQIIHLGGYDSLPAPEKK